MKFDQHPTRNYFIVGNGKTMTIRDSGVFYEHGASGENHTKTKTDHHQIHSKNSVFGNIGGDWVRLQTFFWTTTAAVF